MKTVCVIGAGVAGLSAARHALERGMSVTVLEQTSEIGGTWVYTENTGKNEFGLNIHSSMYKGLHTNLPKEIMGFPDFPYPPNDKKSYMSAIEVLQFLNSYTDAFDIRRHIKFLHHVKRVLNVNGRWEIFIKELQSGNELTQTFDYIIVCNGHYSEPTNIRLEGMETFTGKSIHSHDYRGAEYFKDENVLVIGAGPSGMDISIKISEQASKVFLSHHLPEQLDMSLPDNFTQKPDVLRISGDQVEFKDGSIERLSSIVYCTGYKYSFPFLDPECVDVEGNYVQPLFKHCININYPTMGFVGLTFHAALSQMMDLQARFVTQFFSGRRELPPREEMLLDTEKEMKERWSRGYPKKLAHFLGPDQEKYFSELSQLAGIENLKPVVTKVLHESYNCLYNHFMSLKTIVFTLIDDETFVKVHGVDNK